MVVSIQLPPCVVGCQLRNFVGVKNVPIWMCILDEESDFTSDAVVLNSNGTLSYGLFQIPEGYWCTYGRPSVSGCRKDCRSFVDKDWRNDLDCVKRIINKNGYKMYKSLTKCVENPYPFESRCYCH